MYFLLGKEENIYRNSALYPTTQSGSLRSIYNIAGTLPHFRVIKSAL